MSKSIKHVGSFPPDQILGMGRTGIVVRHDDKTAVKFPIRWESSSDDQVQANIEDIQHEQSVYQRLNNCQGVVHCYGFDETSIQLELMTKGDLRSYLFKNRPSKALQLRWFREMAQTLARIHDNFVIVVDIASRNFLIDSDMSVKLCDFTEATKFPPGTRMETAEDDGYSIQTDIGQLGAVIYEVVTGKKCEFYLFKDADPSDVSSASWPRRSDLPELQNIWLGEIIERCWTKSAYLNASDLLDDLESVSIEDDTSPISIILAVTITAVVLFTAWRGRRP
jgi:serine/threonine protein kinase